MSILFSCLYKSTNIPYISSLTHIFHTEDRYRSAAIIHDYQKRRSQFNYFLFAGGSVFSDTDIGECSTFLKKYAFEFGKFETFNLQYYKGYL